MQIQYLAYEILIFLMMVMSAVFSGIETSLMTSNIMKLRSLSDMGKKKALKSIAILNNLEDAIGMTLIANNIVNISAAAFITFIATKSFLIDDSALFIVTIGQTMVFLILCEIIPKVVARSMAESFLMTFSTLITVLMHLFRPLIRASLFLSVIIRRILNYEPGRYSFSASREDLGMLFELGLSEGLIDEDHHDYINEILSFNQVTAYEVMTPLIDLVSIERKQSIRQLIRMIDETRFSRIPVHDGRVDNIIGYIYFRDLLKNKKIKNIEEIMIKPHFVPSTKRINSLFQEMQEKKYSIVFVASEFGAIEGMITMEDIAEEIVGEIQTRDHPDTHLIKRISPKKYILSGNLDINFFQRRFDVVIEKKDFETLAGFMIYYLERIPKKGDRLEYGNCVFTVDEATDRSVERILLQIGK